jgi:type II secretory pathway component HofQ
MMRIALAVLVAATPITARASDVCAPTVQHHGAAIDLDLERADIRGALRLVADAAKLGLVLGDDVTGTVTIHLKGVPWDAAACAIASIAHVELELADKILIARKAIAARP